MFISIVIILFTLYLFRFLPKELSSLFFFGIIIRILIAIINTTVGIPGGNGDSLRFFRFSLSLDRYYEKFNIFENSLRSYLLGHHSYVHIHSLLQKISIKPSYFASHCLSILISSIAIIFILKTYLQFNNSTIKGCKLILLIYNLSPSIITNQTFVLRECFQSLALILLIYLPIKLIKLKEKKLFVKYNFFMVAYISTILFSLTLHKIFLVITPIIIFFNYLAGKKLLSFKELKKIFRLNPSRNWLVLFLLITFLVTAFLNYAVKVDSNLLEKSILESAKGYQMGQIYTIDAASNYENSININNPFSTIKPFFLYLIAPLGLGYKLNDLITYPEKFLLIYFIFKILFNIKKINYFKEGYFIYSMILIWLITNFIFSLGTWNWGTAIRHLVPSYSFLLIPYIYITQNLNLKRKTNF